MRSSQSSIAPVIPTNFVNSNPNIANDNFRMRFSSHTPIITT